MSNIITPTVDAVNAQGIFRLNEIAEYKRLRRWPIQSGIMGYGINYGGFFGTEVPTGPYTANVMQPSRMYVVVEESTLDWTFASGFMTGAAELLKSDGTRWGIGGTSGTPVHGDGTVTVLPILTQLDESSWTKIAVMGAAGGIGIQANTPGVWAWGIGTGYRLGTGLSSSAIRPVQTMADKEFVDCACASTASFAVTTTGELWSVGNATSSFSGITGQGSATGSIVNWTRIGTDSDWDRVVAGPATAAARKTNGDWYWWGEESSTRLGTSSAKNSPTLIAGANGALDVVMGSTATFLLHSDRSLYSVGSVWNNGRNLAWTNITTDPILTSVQHVSAGADGGAAVTTSGLLYTWGDRGVAAYRPNDFPSSASDAGNPVQVPLGTTTTSIQGGTLIMLP